LETGCGSLLLVIWGEKEERQYFGVACVVRTYADLSIYILGRGLSNFEVCEIEKHSSLMGRQCESLCLSVSAEGKENSQAEGNSKGSEAQVEAPKYWVSKFHGELVGGFVGGGFGFGGEVED
jgi:hypothetical protein